MALGPSLPSVRFDDDRETTSSGAGHPSRYAQSSTQVGLLSLVYSVSRRRVPASWSGGSGGPTSSMVSLLPSDLLSSESPG